MSRIEITVFRKSGGILSKRISLLKSGKIKADGSECRMREGTARRILLDDVAALAALINNMCPDEALALGRLRAGLPAEVSVRLKKELNDSTPSDTIARSTDYLVYAAGKAAYMLLDHDRKGMPNEVAAKLKELGGFWSALLLPAPALTDAARVYRRSTSAGLYRRDRDKREWLGGSAGAHVYIAVRDGADIERALKTLHQRLWLVGFGYYVIGAAGQLLERSIIDAAVYGPERLVFEGAPILLPPVAQDRETRQPRVHNGDIIDTTSAIPPLSDEEQARLSQLKAAASARLRPEAAAARKTWVREFAARHGMHEAEAERIAADAANYILCPEFDLAFDDCGPCTVRDVLADPENYVNQTLADPLEGVAYGRGKAKVFRRHDGQLMINSFAHGGIRYRLAGQGVGLDDFYAHMEKHNYIYTPTREPWPTGSVNARIPPVALYDANGNPLLDQKGNPKTLPASTWLDQNQPVEQITWAPGLPLLIENRLISEGGWIVRNNVRCLNLYKPPNLNLGNWREVGPWLEHIDRIYPEDVEHIVSWLARRVQRPEEKINHALVLGGAQGIGKDTTLEPVKHAVGSWNFQEVSPRQAMGRFNGFLKSVILRVNEARDLGEFDRYSFYDHMKAYTAAPPDVLRIDEKNLREHSIMNCCGVIITTNHKTDGIYLPADDRRHYVAWSECKKEEFDQDYWNKMWRWCEHGGIGHVAAYLSELDISDFNAKAPPPQTAAWLDIVDANAAPEEAELADVLDKLGNPLATTLQKITFAATGDIADWLEEPKNRRAVPYRLEQCGYVRVRNAARKDGLWIIEGRRQAIYAKSELSVKERLRAAQALGSESSESSGPPTLFSRTKMPPTNPQKKSYQTTAFTDSTARTMPSRRQWQQQRKQAERARRGQARLLRSYVRREEPER